MLETSNLFQTKSILSKFTLINAELLKGLTNPFCLINHTFKRQELQVFCIRIALFNELSTYFRRFTAQKE